MTSSERPLHKSWLDDLNEALAALEFGPATPADDQLPMLLVTGIPRSGTTYMLQCLQQYGNCAVVDHLVAALWSTPWVGVRLSQFLQERTAAESLKVSGTSTLGLTPNWYEAHEFSYFWRDALGWGSPHEEPARRTLESMSFSRVAFAVDRMRAASTRPLAVKGFPALWCGEELLEACPRLEIIVMTRNPARHISSLVHAWEAHEDEWFSLRPAGWRSNTSLPKRKKAEFQYAALAACVSRLLSSDNQRIHSVSIESLVDRPAHCVAEILRRREG